MRSLSLIVLLLLLPCSFALDYYPEAGRDDVNSNRGLSSAAIDDNGMIQYSNALPTGAQTGFADIPPLVGDIDGDGVPDIIFAAGSSSFAIYHWDNDSSFEVAYASLATNGTPLSINAGSVPLLYDVDADGDHEVYYCGTDGTGYVGAYDYNATTGEMYELWRTSVGGNCISTTGGATAKNYFPTAGTINGTKKVFFILPQTGNTLFLTAWSFDALTGTEQALNMTETHSTCTGATNLYYPGAVPDNEGDAINDMYGSGTVYKNRPGINIALCNAGTNSEPRIFIPADCSITGIGAPNGRGLASIRPDSMTYATEWGQAGYLTIGDTDYYLNSPSCYPSDASTTTEMLTFHTWVAGTITLYGSLPTTIFAIDDESIGSITTITDPFLGEFSSDTNPQFDDVCVLSYHTDGKLRTFCSDIDDPASPAYIITEEITGIGAFNLYPTVHTTSNNLLGGASVANNDFVSNAGIYQAAPDGTFLRGRDQPSDALFIARGFNYVAEGPSPIDGSCTLADIDENGESDVLCAAEANVTLFLSNAVIVAPQQPSYTVTELSPVNGRCLSGGSCSVANNETLLYGIAAVEHDGDGILYYAYDCDTRFAPGPTALQFFTSPVNVSCSYSTTGDARSRFWVTDALDYENDQNISVLVYNAETGSVCNFNGIPEPSLGETETNCAPDFAQQPDPGEANASAANASRNQLLESIGLTDQELLTVDVSEEGEITATGFLPKTTDILTRFGGYLFLLLLFIIPLIVLLALQERFSR